MFDIDTRFEPFSKGDWLAYSGCESAEPRIGLVNLAGRAEDDPFGFIEVVLDGRSLNAVVFPSEPLSETLIYAAEFASEASAELIGELILNSVRPEELVRDFMEEVGVG